MVKVYCCSEVVHFLSHFSFLIKIIDVGMKLHRSCRQLKIKKMLFIFFFDVFVYHFNGFIGIPLVAQLLFSSFNSLLAAKWSFFGTINLTSVY